jgi:kynureninase
VTHAWDGAARARELDAADPLAALRESFHIPEGILYLDGNSLGLLSRESESSLLRALDEWKRLGVRGWFSAEPPWIEWGERLGDRVAPLVGAAPGEVVVTGSTTVNLHHLVATLYTPRAGRDVIVAAEIDFPSDLHALRGEVALRGLDPGRCLRLVRSRDGRTIEEADVEAAIGDDVAIVALSQVLYKSGQLLDAARITSHAHARGALAGWDLSHSIGAVPVRLDEWGADFAIWCHYKYLNAGPGAIAGLFLARAHHGRQPALPGWWGQDRRAMFEMRAGHEPAPDARAWQIGTIPILSVAPLWGSLELIERAGIARIREKSLGLTAFLMECVERAGVVSDGGARIGTPREAHRRGGHVALETPHAGRVRSALARRGVVTDFRPPDAIRLTPSPLTTRYADVWEAVAILSDVLSSESWREEPEDAGRVG